MQIAQLSWISPKGYGLATLEGGENAFVPAEVLENYNVQEALGKKVRVTLGQGSIGKIVTGISFETEPLFASLSFQ